MSATYRALEDYAARGREQSEALARPARIRFFVRVSGSGESRLEGKQGIFFGAYMLEVPTFTWGVAAVDQIPPGGVPLVTACVLKYHKNQKFFTGCDMGFNVEATQLNIRLDFSLTFEGTTLRTTAPMTNRVQ